MTQKQQLKTKRLLAAQGFYEASTLAFYSNAELDMLHIPAEDAARKAIRILNPISENLSIMRTLLTPVHAECHRGQPQEGQCRGPPVRDGSRLSGQGAAHQRASP